MKYLVTGKEMKLLDQNTSGHFRVPEMVLMEQAAMHFVWRLCDILNETNTKENAKGIVFCGLGNNGADGVAIARLLNEKGISTQICRINDQLKNPGETSPSYQLQNEIYSSYQYPVQNSLEEALNGSYDFVIDAIFGIGLSRILSDEYLNIIQKINDMSGLKVAVDMPSGVNADNGQLMGAGVKCDYTITFSFAKAGQYLWPGNEFSGKVCVEEIGITKESWLDKKPTMAYLEMDDLNLLPKRPAHSNKGTFGKLLVIAGSENMAGAAALSAKAAYRCGVGLVKVFTHIENKAVIQASVPEVLVSTYQSKLDAELLIEDINWADAIVIGPGLGKSAVAREIVEVVLKNSSVPVVWDADGINILAEDIQRLLLPHTEYILTPHLGEFSRLVNKSIFWIQNHFVESALEFAREYDVICTLKDFRTLTACPYGINFLNVTGNNGMATGGSGDVLSGIIGALLVQGVNGVESSALGVLIHGLAGDFARKKMGTHAIMASDIIDALKDVWKGIDYAEY